MESAREPTHTVKRLEYDMMVENLCSQIATLEMLVDFAVDCTEDFEDRFYHSWKHTPKVIKSTREYFNNKRGDK